MANILSELFTNTANSIRGGLGDIGKISPSSFPSKIDEIVGLIGSGQEIVCASGSYVPSVTGTVTVEHKLGIVPDIIFIRSGSTVSSASLTTVTGLCSELVSDTAFPLQIGCVKGTNDSVISSNLSILNKDSSSSGFITDANPKTFRIGGSSLNHIAGSTYYWNAIGGLAKHSGYCYIRPTLDGNGNLIVAGGVPEIEQLQIYVDNVLAITVPYVHEKSFSVDISSVADNFKQHTISVKAIGDNFVELYPNVYYDSAKGWVSTPAILGVSGMYAENINLTRTDDAIGLNYTINSNGTINSDFDSIFPWCEAKLVTDAAGNGFVQMPEMWFRVGTDNSGRITDIAVSAVKHDDGEWYKVDPFCYGRYGGYVSSSKLYSKTGMTRTGAKKRSEFRSYASANGTGYHQLDLYHRTVMMFLWWIEWATKQARNVMGGRYSGSGTSGGSTKLATGGTNSLSTPSGYITTNGQMRWHYIEDFVGNQKEWLDGVCRVALGTSAHDYASKSVFSDSSTSMSMLSYPTKNGAEDEGQCIAAFGWDKNNPFLCLPTSHVNNANYDTYFCDGDISRSASSPCVVIGDAYNANYSYNGITLHWSFGTTTAYADIGGRLMYDGKLG